MTAKAQDWTVQDIPDQTGRVVLVTGANSGTGFAAAKALAGRGAQVILACRQTERAMAAEHRIRQELPGAFLERVELDLGSLASVGEAARVVLARLRPVQAGQSAVHLRTPAAPGQDPERHPGPGGPSRPGQHRTRAPRQAEPHLAPRHGRRAAHRLESMLHLAHPGLGNPHGLGQIRLGHACGVTCPFQGASQGLPGEGPGIHTACGNN